MKSIKYTILVILSFNFMESCSVVNDSESSNSNDNKEVTTEEKEVSTPKTENKIMPNNILQIDVQSSYADCMAMVAQKCLKIKKEGETKFELFYEEIKGFKYEEGYTYKLKVRIDTIENPPADASNLSYTLIEVLSKESSSFSLDIDGEWKVSKVLNKQVVGLSFNLNSNNNEIKGFSGCNHFSGKIELSQYRKTLSISDLLSTFKACPRMEIEDEFNSTLKSITGYKIENNKLFLLQNEIDVIVAVR